MAASYGQDLSCVDDLDDGMTEVSGRLCLGQAIARRLITPRGGLIDDENYGFNVTGYLNDDVDAATLALIQAGVEGEAVKDERVISATATVTFLNGALTIVLALTDGEGPFTLVLNISDVTVEVLKAG